MFGNPQECYAGHGNVAPSVEPQPAPQSNGKIRQRFQALNLKATVKKRGIFAQLGDHVKGNMVHFCLRRIRKAGIAWHGFS